jgi:hypothetical protein
MIGAIEDDDEDPSIPLGLLEHKEPVQGLHTLSVDGVGAAETKESAEQVVVIVQAQLPIVLLKVEGGHTTHTRSTVNVGGVNSVKPLPHVVKEPEALGLADVKVTIFRSVTVDSVLTV